MLRPPSSPCTRDDARPLLDIPQRCTSRKPSIQHLLTVPLGGVVLWSRSFTPAASQSAGSSASPVNSLIRDALIEGRSAESHFEKDGYALKWSFVNDLELIFVVRELLSHAVWCMLMTVVGRVPAHTSVNIRRRAACCSQDPLRQALPAVPHHLRCLSPRVPYCEQSQRFKHRLGDCAFMGLCQGL